MSEHADHSEPNERTGRSDPVETPPEPQTADIPPSASQLSEDRLDSIENARRTASDRWKTDLVLVVVYAVATVVLIAAIVLARRHYSHH